MTTFSLSRSAVRLPALLVGAALVGVAAGAGTSWLQGWLSGGWNLLANSGAVWTAVAFAVAAGCSGSRRVGVSAGALALLGEVAGYYALAAPVRGIATSVQEEVLWTVAALWFGPAAGFAGHAARRGPAAGALAAWLALGGVVAGEACHLLARVHQATAGVAELVAGLGLTAVALVALRTSWAVRAYALGLGAVVAALTFVVYGVASF